MANNKKSTYMTVGQIRRQERENRFKKLKFDDDKIYSVDEIRQAAIDQGLIERPEPTIEPLSLNENDRQSAESENPLDLRNTLKKIKTETIPKIQEEAIRNYNLSKVGRDYLSKYDDSTSYTDVKNDIEELKYRKGGAERRDRDTAVYDRAIAMLEEYAANNYSLNDNKTSYADKEAIYEDNKQIEEGLGEKSNSATDPMYRDYALMTWLGSYDHKGIKDSSTNQEAIKSFNEATGGKGYDLSGELGGLKDDEIASKADELRTYFQDKYGYKYNTDYLNAAQNFYSDLQNRYNKAKTENKTYERTGEAAAYTSDIVKKDDYADKSTAGDYGTPTTKEDIDEYLKNNQAVDYNNIQGFDSKNVDSLPDKLGSFLSAEDIKDQNTSSEFSPERQIAINLQKTDNSWTHPVDDPLSGYDDLMTEGYNNGWDVISDEEKGSYYYIYNTEGKEAAYEYLNSLKNTLQKRKNYDNVKEATQNSADSGTVDNLDFILRSAASVPDNAFGGASGTLDNVAHYISGEDIEPYSPAHAAALSAAATREASGEALDEQFWHTDSPWGVNPSDIYGGVMSSADMLTSYLAGEAPYGALMGLSASESTARDLYEQGEDNATIAAVSTASGIAEALFEKLSIEQIWNIANLDGAKTAKEIVKKYAYNMARAAGVEASEEVATEAANMVVDNIVRGSRSDTANASIEDIGSRLYKAGVGGAIGGLVGEGGATTLSATAKGAELIQNQSERNKYIASVGADVTEAGNTQALLDTADQMKDNAAVQAQAQKVRQAQTKNAEKGTESSAKTLSRETGKLYAAIQDNNVQGIQNAEASEIKAAIKQAYAAETGEDVKSDTVTQAAEAIYKSEYTGEKLTRAERNLASTSQAQSAVESVRNNPDLIEQGTQKAQERAFNKYISTAQLTQKQETKADEDVDIAEFHFHKDDGKVYTADGKKQVDIASVASIGKNDITFALKDGQTESAKALDMPTKQAVIAQSVLDVQKSMGVDLTPEIANTLYNGYEQSDIKSVSAYMQDAKKVLFNGYTNNTKIDNTINLPQGLRNRLYSMGRQLAASHTQAQQQAVIGRVKGNKPRKGSVTFVDGIKRGQLDARRRAGVDTVESLAQSLGFDVVFYRSTKNGKGRYSSEYVRKKKFTADGQQAPSGFWRGGKMYLDVNAGMNGEGLILFTASHELVHLIREGSPEMFQELADFLVQNYAEQGVDVNDLILKEMNKSTNLTRDEAFEEVIAESCETFLRDTHLNGKAQELYKQNPTLWSRIREALKRIINAIKEAYAVARPQSEEAIITNRADIETLEKAYDLWTKGIIKSAENLRNMESERADTKYQGRSESTDAEYLDAVDRGDMETAQRMVDEAAKAAGYDSPKLFHGTKFYNGFTTFANSANSDLLPRGTSIATWFSNKKSLVRSLYGEGTKSSPIFSVYINSGKSLIIDAEGANFNHIALPESLKNKGINKYISAKTWKVIDSDFAGTEDIAKYAYNQGYDSVIFKDLIDGEIRNGIVSDIYAVFSAERVKSADPVTYDDNGDVIPLSERFNESNKDIRFSLRENVEETRDLIAVHNLTEEKLLKSLRLGGLPMPSVAVIKAENGHKGYGDISIVFSKETIDPSENRNNKLYGGDVWSPTYPSIDYEVDTKKANNIYARAREALQKPAAYRLNPVTFHPENIADRINSYGGEQGFIEHYKNDYGMKQFYLAEQDQAVPDRYVEKRNEISDVDKQFYSFIADQLGKEAFSQEATKTGREWNNRYADDLDNARIDYMRSVYGELSKEEEENLRRDFESERRVQKFRIARSVQEYLENGGVTVERKLDEDGIKADIDKLVDQSKYEEWLKELFNGIEKSSGIYNGTDYYTSSGNRRSFAQTHYTETLANVVRVMKSQDNGDSFFGGNGLWAIAAKNYGTIEEMKADKDRLTNLSDEERQEISNRFGERFTEIASSIANDGDNEFLALDNAYGNICEAVRNTNTKSGLLRELQKYHHKATVATVDDILDLVSDVGNMPVNYFEAKPQRAIKFNEVSIAVIPDNASQALRTALDKAGVKYVEYASGNEEARTEILNSLEDVKFQSRDDDLFSIDLSDDDTIIDVAAREFATHHEDMGEVLKNISDIDIEPKRVDSIINRVAREYLGSLDAEAKHTLSIEIQLALERVNNTDAQTVSDTIIDAVRRAIEKGTVSDERAEANYKDLLDAFKGKKFYLSDEQINQLKEHDMTLDSFRKAMFGKMTIVNRENAKRSVNGGYADAQQLSLEGLHDVLADADAVLGLRSWQWDQENYDAPYIIKEAFDGLNALRNQPVSQVYSDQDIDDMAIAMSAKITGGIVEAKYNSRKNPYITKLVNDLKAKRSEAVKKQKEKNRQKLSELKQKERERAEKRETELKKKYQEQRDKSREGRKRTELRHKIRNLTDSLQKRLTKPKGSQYVPRQLIAQTVDVLNAVNLDTGRSVRLSEKLALLRNEYDKLKDREESYAMYDGVISNMLLGLNDTVGNTSIMDMTLSQLKQVYDTIRSMDHVIRESVKMTDTNFKHDAHQVGRDWIAEIRAVPKSHVGALSGYVQTMLSAERFFNRIAGFKKNSTSLKLFDMLNKGQLATTQYEMEFTQIFADLIQDKQIKSLYDTKNMVDIGLVDEDGNKVPITRGMMLSLYMHLQNEDNIRHVMGGGLTVPDMKDYYKGDVKKAFGKGMKSVRVGQLDYSRYAEGIKSVIEKQLTEYERGWIEAAHEFFDEASRKALNETTMKLYGFRRANVDNYFPIHTDSNYRAASFENIVRDMSLENSGFMKERVKASNPILLEDIVDVVNDQISKTAKYCGMTLPIKNFEKVYGTTTVGFDTSVQKELNKKFSASSSNTGATKYIDNLLTDLTSGRSSDDGPFAKWLGHARGFLAQSTLTLNPRVAIAQTASVVTAAPVVGYKNITKALTSQYFKVSDEEIAEITPLFWLRRQGYATIEIGDIATLRKQKHKIQSKAAKALNWINAMDSWAVRRLFVASKYYMQENYPNLDPQSDEYKQKLSEVYNKVIEKTQPNYTVLQRPDILRNPNALLKSLTMFMTQRLQNFNIIYDSVGTFNKYNADYKAGINNVTADDVKEARNTLIRSITSQVASAATIVGMKLFADFLLHSMNGYRDDDDEITAESLSLTLLDNFADTVFGNILFASEFYSAVKSLVFKKRYYGISLSGISSIVDAITDIINLNNGVTVESVNKVAMSVCQVLGIPLRNAEKIGKAIYYWISDISSGEFMESGIERNTKQNIHRYETKLLSGDNDGAKKIVDEMIKKKKAKGKNDKDAKSDVRSNFTTEYKKRYLEALKSNNAEEIKNIRQTLYSSGLYGTLSDLDKVMQKWVAADKKEQSK